MEKPDDGTMDGLNAFRRAFARDDEAEEAAQAETLPSPPPIPYITVVAIDDKTTVAKRCSQGHVVAWKSEEGILVFPCARYDSNYLSMAFTDRPVGYKPVPVCATCGEDVPHAST